MFSTNIRADAASKRKKALWDSYNSAPTPENRDALISEYSYLVKNAASRLSAYLGRAADGFDLVNEGIPGLIDAIYKYRPGENGRFEDFAGSRIRKSMLDTVIKAGGAREKIINTKKAIDQKRKELEENNSSVSNSDVARALDMPLSMLVEAETAFTLSSGSSFSYLEEAAAPPLPIDHAELAGRLNTSMQNLSNREKKIILMFYYEDLSRAEIARIMDMDDTAVLSVLGSAMRKMQEDMAEYMDVFVRAV